jgi:hypothetical protein
MQYKVVSNLPRFRYAPYEQALDWIYEQFMLIMKIQLFVSLEVVESMGYHITLPMQVNDQI